MALVIVLLVLALIIGGIGLLITGLKWLLIVALVLVAVSLVSGAAGRRSRAYRYARAMADVPLARHLLRAKDLADARYFEPLAVADLAAAAGLSPAYFSREFRRAFGESPHQYLLTRRLERAAALLRTTDRSVTEICFAVGLASLGSFTTSFRRVFGTTPLAYRAAVPAGRVDDPHPRAAWPWPTAVPQTARFEKSDRARRSVASTRDHAATTDAGGHDDADRQRPVLGARPGRGPRLLHPEARVGGALRRHDGRTGTSAGSSSDRSASPTSAWC